METSNNFHQKQEYDFDAIIICDGKDDNTKLKTTYFIVWLFGYQLIDAIFIFTKKSIIIVGSQKKSNFIQLVNFAKAIQQKNKGNNVLLIIKQKENRQNFKKIWEVVQNDSKKEPKIGYLIKQQQKGELVEEFSNFFKSQVKKEFDISAFVSDLLSIKSSQQIQLIQTSAKITINLMEKVINQVQVVIDQGQQCKHKQIAQKMENQFESPNQIKKIQQKYKINKNFIGVSFTPIIQSGGNYNFKIKESNNQILKYDTILITVGTQYLQYNTILSRTLFIDSTSQQKKIYQKVTNLFKLLMTKLKPDIKLKSVYEAGVQFLKTNLPKVQLPNNFGHGIGLQLKQNILVINEINEKIIKQGMVFNLVIALNNIKEKDKIFAIHISDIIVITDQNKNLTNFLSKLFVDVSYQLNNEVPNKKPVREKQSLCNQCSIDEGRRKKPQMALTNITKRTEHQTILKQKKLEELRNKDKTNIVNLNKNQKIIDLEKIETYKNIEQLPKNLKKNQIYVDLKNLAIILPLFGQHVPFHGCILKNLSKGDQKNQMTLRLNFHQPGSFSIASNITFPKIAGKTVFIKEMVFRSETEYLSQIYKQIKQLQKRIKAFTTQQKNKDIMEFQKIQLVKIKRPQLRNISVRPNFLQKKTAGILDCQLNGFRFNSSKGQVLDIPFSNIKACIFQPCVRQAMAAIHINLKNPMMLGKKKTQDVQFYCVVSSSIEDINGRGRRYEDQDDQEQREKVQRYKLNKQFQAFIKSCQQFSKGVLRFEIPNQDGFYGTPYKTSSFLQFTQNCLLNLTDSPFFILYLKDIQVAFFERMYANIRNCDLTFVCKDYNTAIRISSIQMDSVQKIKDWLDKRDIIFYDLQKSMSWANFLKIIRDDFKRFVQQGGWMAWDSDKQEENQQDQQSQFQMQKQQSNISSQQTNSDQQYQQQDQKQSQYQQQSLSEQGLSWDQLQQKFEKCKLQLIRGQNKGIKVNVKIKKIQKKMIKIHKSILCFQNKEFTFIFFFQL